MNILTLDQSFSKCGYCHNKQLGVFYPSGNDETEKMKSILKFIEDKSPEVVVVEGLSFGSVSTSVRMLGYLFFRLKEWCYDNKAEFNEVSPMTLKKCSGKGSLKKWMLFQNAPEEDQKKMLLVALEGQTDKKKLNMLERHKELEKNAKYFETSTCLFDVCDSYWLDRYYRKECL
jgi:hypothetical protein